MNEQEVRISKEDVACMKSAVRLLKEEGFNRETVEPKERLLQKLEALASLKSLEPKVSEIEKIIESYIDNASLSELKNCRGLATAIVNHLKGR